MAIRKRINYFIFILIIIISIMIFPNFNRKKESCLFSSEMDQEENIQYQSTKLVDKVYTFTPVEYSYTMSISLQNEYDHTIEVTVVTPHYCVMNITLWDPENKEFQLFYRTISQADGVMYAPFGVALAGNHTFLFEATTTMNLNIHLEIIREDYKCLYDKIPLGDQDDIAFYEVSRFGDGTIKEHYISFVSDYKYTCYIGRVSAISLNQSNRGAVDYHIVDPYDIDFVIYTNDSLASTAGVNTFWFGTAAEGLYKIQITLDSDVDWMNVAYAIINSGPIGQQIDPNETENEDTTPVGSNFSIPLDLALYTIAFGGGITGVIMIFVIFHRKKNTINLKTET